MSVRAQELIASLEAFPNMPTPEVVDEIYACGEAAVPGLRALVRKYPTRPEPDWPVDIAVGLLGDLDAGEAFEDLRELLRKAELETEETIGDAMRKLTAVPAADFIGMLRDHTLEWSQRCVALDGLCGVMVHRHGEAGEIEDALETYLTELAKGAKSLSEDDQRVGCMVALTLAQRGSARHRPAVEAAFEAGLESDMISKDDVLKSFDAEDGDDEDVEGDTYRDRYKSLYRPAKPQRVASSSPAGADQTFTGSSAASEKVPGGPPITREKIGRNDPCPCGSGKKYKKCCGK